MGAQGGDPHGLPVLAIRSNGQSTALEIKRVDDIILQLQFHIPVWEMLLHEMEKPGRDVIWEHVPAHVNVHGNEVANGLAMEGMCSSPLWSKHVLQDSSDSESTVGLRGGPGSESEDTTTLWASLGLVPIYSDEMTGEASGEPAPHGTESCSSGRGVWGRVHADGMGGGMSQQTESESQSFMMDVSDTRRQRKRRKFRKRPLSNETG